jgi:hypothetical protein
MSLMERQRIRRVRIEVELDDHTKVVLDAPRVQDVDLKALPLDDDLELTSLRDYRVPPGRDRGYALSLTGRILNSDDPLELGVVPSAFTLTQEPIR